MLGRCALEDLRKRKSHKWRSYPPDVLPAFVAEMDFDLAEPIVEAVRAAMSIGDCGYGHKGELGEAFAAFAAKRLRWSPDPARVFAIPDVMTGIAEVIQAITPPGSGIVITPPVYQPFFYRPWIPRHSTGPWPATMSAPACSPARTTRRAGSGPVRS